MIRLMYLSSDIEKKLSHFQFGDVAAYGQLVFLNWATRVGFFHVPHLISHATWNPDSSDLGGVDGYQCPSLTDF